MAFAGFEKYKLRGRMEIKESIGALVRQHRITRKWIQDKLSSEAGINNRFLQKIEAGDRMPSLVIVFKIANAFGISPDKLLMPIWKEWLKNKD